MDNIGNRPSENDLSTILASPELIEQNLRLSEICMAAAMLAGQYLVVQQLDLDGISVEEKSGRLDLVTGADLTAEKIIKDYILSNSPEDAFLGEESGYQTGTSNNLWIVDALDGTTNFMESSSDYGVSVSVAVQNVVVASASYLPAVGQVFRASLHGGATLNDETLRPDNSLQERGEIIIGLSTVSEHQRKIQTNVHSQLKKRWENVGDIKVRSATRAMCQVATGEVKGFYQGWLPGHDFLGPSLIASEAGMISSDLHGHIPNSRSVVVASPSFHRDFKRQINVALSIANRGYDLPVSLSKVAEAQRPVKPIHR